MKLKIAICILPLLFCFAGAVEDPIATEITRWLEFTRTNPATDEDWKSIKEITEPVLNRADIAIKNGHRFYALHLLGAAEPLVASKKFAADRPAEVSQQMKALEAEWKKIGVQLRPAIASKSRPQYSQLPAAIRAIAEASYSQIKPYYEASLEYGKNTAPEYGLYYLAQAVAERDFVDFCSKMRDSNRGKEIAITNLDAELDAFEDQVLAKYKPPASIDQHPLFIRISATIKEAREMNNAGFRFGALYRYLDARLRFSRLDGEKQGIELQDAEKRADEVKKRLKQQPFDHSIAQLFMEMALSEISNPAAGTNGRATAKAIFDAVLPHYFAALQPAQAIESPNHSSKLL